MRRVLAGGVLFLVALLSASLDAIYMQVLVDTVPIARVIESMTKQVVKAPRDGQAHWALARAHAMAASNPARTVEVTRNGGRLWLGYEPRYVPFDRVPATMSASTGAPLRAHLDLAIAHHRQAIELLPGNEAVRLGLAWCLQQAGRTQEAIREYRTAIAAAWPVEGQKTSLGFGGHTIVAEAAGYLIPLLDPVRDAKEIRTLRARQDQLEALPMPITPLVVDLTGAGDPRALLDEDARVSFDLDGRGKAGVWDWITPRAAWVVWDPKRTGRIHSGTQLFGSVTFLMFWRTGYDALATLDDDGDGWLRGEELAGLALWHDRDGDGQSDPGEVATVDAHRIVAMAARGDRGDGHRVAGSATVGVRYADGRTRATFDLVLQPVSTGASSSPAATR